MTILIESIPTSAESVSSQNDVKTAGVVAYARYIIPTRRAWENMFSYPPAGEGMDQKVLDDFLRGLERVQRCTMGVEVESVGTDGGRRYLCKCLPETTSDLLSLLSRKLESLILN